MESPISTAGLAGEKTDLVVSKGNRADSQLAGEVQDIKGTLTLLDLPIEILQLIVKEVAPTSSLTALARTNTVLHNLAIPLIYSDLDIVWPTLQRDARIGNIMHTLLTFGLGNAFTGTLGKTFPSDSQQPTRLLDSDYAKYTKRFSLLGTGPLDSIPLDHKGGKMLGVLVASAITRMKNLESFVWDMQTGVPSRVFEALASLAHRSDHEFQGRLTPIGVVLPADRDHPPPRPPVRYAEYHCEYPTFSVLPPLKSLVVLDIDEVGYLDEMAVLIERSKDMLQDLRVSISAQASARAFAQCWDAPKLSQIDHQARWPGESTIGDLRLGGVLGVLVGKIFDIRRTRKRDDAEVDTPVSGDGGLSSTTAQTTATQALESQTAPSSHGEVSQQPDSGSTTAQNGISAETGGQLMDPEPSKPDAEDRKRLTGRLRLRTLELERVALSMQVMRFAFDWSVLTDLTLLKCPYQDVLWKVLRKEFTPASPGANTPLHYQLALKAIRTNLPTHSLLAFTKETLAPNSLEVLFLQDRILARNRVVGPLSLDEVFQGAIKRHHASLRKLFLDSSSAPNFGDNHWRRWALTTDILMYITSGRMTNLQELAVSMEYKDWHTFLRRLPNLPNLVALNIPRLANRPSSMLSPPPSLFTAAMIPAPNTTTNANPIPAANNPVANPPTANNNNPVANLPTTTTNSNPFTNPTSTTQLLTNSLLMLTNALTAQLQHQHQQQHSTTTTTTSTAAAAAAAGAAGAYARDTAFDHGMDLACQVADVLALCPGMKLAYFGVGGRGFEVVECTRSEKGKGKGKGKGGDSGGGSGGSTAGTVAWGGATAAESADVAGGVAGGLASLAAAAATAIAAGASASAGTGGNGSAGALSTSTTTSTSASAAGSSDVQSDDISVELDFSSEDEDDDGSEGEGADGDDNHGNLSPPTAAAPAMADPTTSSLVGTQTQAKETAQQGNAKQKDDEEEEHCFLETPRVTLKVRELVYFDDKASIFWVRNGLKLGTP
ncbi:hypothetical protein VTI74DRAFT_7466 [Chaetomium olivicolor]